MTISATEPLIAGPYNGNGVTTVFSYAMSIFAETELLVFLRDGDGVETLQTLATDYTVTPTGGTYPATGGIVTMIVPPPTGVELIILPDITRSQDRPFSSQSSITLQEVEDALDKLTAITRQLYERSLRAVTVSAFDPGDVDTLLANVTALVALEAQIQILTTNISAIISAEANLAAIIAAPAEAAAADASADAAAISAAAALVSELAAAASAALAATFDPALFVAKAGAETITGLKTINVARQAIQTVTWGASITLDLATANKFAITLGGATAINNPTNVVAGQSIMIDLLQDGVGGRLVTWGSYFKFPGGVAPLLSAEINRRDILVGEVISATEIVCTVLTDVR